MSDNEASCRRCGSSYIRSDASVRKGDWTCQHCKAEQDRASRLIRKQEGRLKVTVMPREYHAAYEREWRKRPEVRKRRGENQKRHRSTPDEALKVKSRRMTRTAIANGTLIKGVCEKCGDTRVEAHHDDYSQPLAIRWLCRAHHNMHHRKAREQSA